MGETDLVIVDARLKGVSRTQTKTFYLRRENLIIDGRNRQPKIWLQVYCFFISDAKNLVSPISRGS